MAKYSRIRDIWLLGTPNMAKLKTHPKVINAWIKCLIHHFFTFTFTGNFLSHFNEVFIFPGQGHINKVSHTEFSQLIPYSTWTWDYSSLYLETLLFDVRDETEAEKTVSIWENFDLYQGTPLTVENHPLQFSNPSLRITLAWRAHQLMETSFEWTAILCFKWRQKVWRISEESWTKPILIFIDQRLN